MPSFKQECRETFALALPLIAGQLGQMLMGVVDAAMVGRLGVVPLGAAAFSNTLVSVPFLLGIGLLSAVSVRVSQARGAGRPDAAREALLHGTALAFIFSLLVMALICFGLPWLPLLHQPAEVNAAAPKFLVLLSISMIPGMLSIAWKNYLDALNRPWAPFYILLGGVSLNAGLNWILIFGKCGIPPLGLEGSGWATLLARTAVALAMLFWLKPSTLGWVGRPFRLSAFLNLMTLGIPASLQLLTEVTAFAAASVLIGTMGAAPLAAHQIAMTCAATAFMVPLGFSMAMTVRVGRIVGAQEWGRLRPVLLGGWVFAIGFICLSMSAFLFAGSQLAHLFIADPAVIEIAMSLLIVAGIFQLFDGIQVVSAGALRGVNDVRVPALISFGVYCGVALPLGYLLAFRFRFGPGGIWIGLAFGLALAALALGGRAWHRLGQ